MTQYWLIYCPHCGKGTTIGKSPKQAGYSKVVNCSLCNRAIDASKGVSHRCVPAKKSAPAVGLLSIGK